MGASLILQAGGGGGSESLWIPLPRDYLNGRISAGGPDYYGTTDQPVHYVPIGFIPVPVREWVEARPASSSGRFPEEGDGILHYAFRRPRLAGFSTANVRFVGYALGDTAGSTPAGESRFSSVELATPNLEPLFSGQLVGTKRIVETDPETGGETEERYSEVECVHYLSQDYGDQALDYRGLGKGTEASPFKYTVPVFASIKMYASAAGGDPTVARLVVPANASFNTQPGIVYDDWSPWYTAMNYET